MATRPYWFAFGAGSPQTTAGLNPTFIMFINSSGQTIAPPSVSQPLAGSGLYLANYSPTQTIAFILDGATTGLANSDRYISGVMDPYDLFGFTLNAIGDTQFAFGTTLVAIGTSHIAQGVTLTAIGTTLLGFGASNFVNGSTLSSLFSYIGSTASSFGSTSIDPTTIFGLLKRAQELSEGNNTYTKATGLLDMYSRGSSTLLREKTISDTSTQTTKT